VALRSLLGWQSIKKTINKGEKMKDCIKEIDACKEIEHIAVRGKYLADVLADQIKELEM